MKIPPSIFLIPYPSRISTKLHDEQSLQLFSEYLSGGKYIFPLGRYSVTIPEYMITNINTTRYFGRYILDNIAGNFIREYQLKVNDLQTFAKIGMQIFSDTADKIADETQKFLLASGILTVSESTVKEITKLDENSQTLEAVNNFWAEADKIDDRTPQGKIQLNSAFLDANILGAMTYDLADMVKNCQEFYKSVLTQEKKNVSFNPPYSQEEIDRAKAISVNTMKHITEPEEILANLSQALTYNQVNSDPLKFLTKYFYRLNDEEILQQLKTLSEFLLVGDLREKWIDDAKKEDEEQARLKLEEKRRQLANVFNMPEYSSGQVEGKINILKDESEKIGYDASEEISRLETKKRTLQEQEAKVQREREEREKEAERERLRREEQARLEREKHEREANLQKALSMPENSVDEIKRKIEAVKLEAKKIGYNSGVHVSKLTKRLREAEEVEAKGKRDKIIDEILSEAMFMINSYAVWRGVAKYFHGMIYSTADEKAFVNSKLESIYKLFAYEMNYPFQEAPILYYDDTLSKNGKDSLLITPFKMYISNFGEVVSIELDDVKKYEQVSKLLSKYVVINDTFKISAALIEGRFLPGFTDVIKSAVGLGIIMKDMFVEDHDELSPANYEVLKNILDGMRDFKIDEDKAKRLIKYLYSINAQEFLANIPERFRYLLDGDKGAKTLGTDFIVKAAHSVNIDNVYFEAGNPCISPSSRKYSNTRKNLKIPNGEDIYLIWDATILGGVRKGFALCTTGLYYCTKAPGFIDWERFSKVKIEKSAGGISIADEEFLCAIDDDMLKLLHNLQERIREKLH